MAAEFYTEDLRIPMAEAGPQGLEAFLGATGGIEALSAGAAQPRLAAQFLIFDRATMSAHKYYGIALEYARRGLCRR